MSDSKLLVALVMLCFCEDEGTVHWNFKEGISMGEGATPDLEEIVSSLMKKTLADFHRNDEGECGIFIQTKGHHCGQCLVRMLKEQVKSSNVSF